MNYVEVLNADNNNSGDTIVDIGNRMILNQIFGFNYFISCYFNNTENISNFNKRFFPNISLISGTPWIWNRCHETNKYKNLLEFTKDKKTYKIDLSIGSSFYLDFDPSKASMNLNIWNNFDLIFCRDTLAYTLLSKVVDNVFLMPCSSFYVHHLMNSYEPVKEDLLIYQNIKTTLHKKKNSLTKDFHRVQYEFYEEKNPDVFVITKEDQDEFLKKYPKSKCKLIKSPIDIYAEISKYKNLLTPRVHSSIPALSYGLNVVNVPSDSRCLTAIGLGAEIHPEMKKYINYNDDLLVKFPLSFDFYLNRLKEELEKKGIK